MVPRTFTANVHGDTADELEAVARKQAAEFFGTDDLHVIAYGARAGIIPAKYRAEITLTDQAPFTIDYGFGENILPCTSQEQQ